MSKFKDLTGEKIGMLEVLKMAPRIEGKPIKWTCQCSCPDGTIKDIDGSNLKQGKVHSCGCLLKESNPREDLIGKTFGELTVLRRFPGTKTTSPMAECLCTCGRTIITSTWHLKSEHTQTCGHCDDLNPGDKFGVVTILYQVDSKGEHSCYRYKCICGREKEAVRTSFITGGTCSCGCVHKYEWNGKTYRSKLEVFMAIYLEVNNIDFEYEKHTFDLNIGDKQTKYTPDFYLIKDDKFLEIKASYYYNNLYKLDELKKTKNIELLQYEGLEKLFKCRMRQLYRKSINDFTEVKNYFSNLSPN